MTRITARSRLHFGLLHPSQGSAPRWLGLDGGAGIPIRQFGGVGLMIDEPAIAVSVRRSDDWIATGPSAAKALGFAQLAMATLPAEVQSPMAITVEQCPPEHVGLGVGTALGLAVARAVCREAEFEFTAVELAAKIGRGERSAIGIHGFDRGGLIVEGGKIPGETISPLIAHHDFPPEWTVKLHQPDDADLWHGQREKEAFAKLRQLPEPSAAEIDCLCRLIVQGILPGIANGDFETFGEAVYEYNARVGELFRPVQGGRYTTPGIEAKILELRKRGRKAVGQSSWGPTVFSIKTY